MSRIPGTPPALARWLLTCAFDASDRACVLSDLDEEFEERHVRDGARPARHWYWDQTRRSLGPALARRWRTRGPGNGRRRAGHARWIDTIRTELTWAWRGLRARRLAGILQVALVALTLAANAIVFSATDAFVFRRVPYPNADRLVILRDPHSQSMRGYQTGLTREEIDAWRRQRDVLAAVQAYEQDGTTYLSGPDGSEAEVTEVVTPGFFAMLGTPPRWGREFRDDEAAAGAPAVAIIAESLARQLYGDPAAAVGHVLPAGGDSPRVVGVMPEGFFFPSALQTVWMPLVFSPLKPSEISRNFSNLALVRPDISLLRASAQIDVRASSVMSSAHTGNGPHFNNTVTAVRLSDALKDPHSSLFTMLFGAAMSLLLVAALNLASLEIAGAFARARTYAVQSALGATRAVLVRTALIEAGVLTICGAILGGALAEIGAAALRHALPTAAASSLITPIAINGRALGFMTASAAITWLVVAIPVVWRASRVTLRDALGADRRATAISPRAARVRQVLTSAQVALTVLLLVGSALYLRTYVAHVREGKGFDSRNLAGIQVLRSPAARPAADLAEDVLARLRAVPGIQSVSQTAAILPATAGGIGGAMHVVGRSASSGMVTLAAYDVDPSYPHTLGIHLVGGRWFTTADTPGMVVVDESFAQRFWPDGAAVGGRFFLGRDVPSAGLNNTTVFEIVGVASHVRGNTLSLGYAGEENFTIYTPIVPRLYAPLNFIARVDHPDQMDAIAALVRATVGPSVVRAELVDDRYAALYGDTRMAAAITTAFGALALVIALVGVYGVLACLVAARTREIGIRLALGAGRRDIRRHVLGASLAFIAVGTAAGLAGAVLASHWIAGQLFGVRPTDPATYAGVALLVVLTSFAATWRPARRAATIDPAITLRAE